MYRTEGDDLELVKNALNKAYLKGRLDGLMLALRYLKEDHDKDYVMELLTAIANGYLKEDRKINDVM